MDSTRADAFMETSQVVIMEEGYLLGGTVAISSRLLDENEVLQREVFAQSC